MDQSVEIERVPLAALDDQHQKPLVEEHLNRYRFCAPHVSGKKVLDAACGVGYGSKLLAQAGAQSVDGIDYSQEAIEAARSKFGHPRVSFQVQNILTFAAVQEYDVVVSFETIEHLQDTPRYLEVMYNALKPGGIFLVSTPNRKVTNPQGTKSDTPGNPFHVFEVTRGEFRELLGEHFEVEAIYGQCPHYYAGSRIRTATSIFMSRRLRQVLRLPDTNYEKMTTVRHFSPIVEPRILVALCRKRSS